MRGSDGTKRVPPHLSPPPRAAVVVVVGGRTAGRQAGAAHSLLAPRTRPKVEAVALLEQPGDEVGVGLAEVGDVHEGDAGVVGEHVLHVKAHAVGLRQRRAPIHEQDRLADEHVHVCRARQVGAGGETLREMCDTALRCQRAPGLCTAPRCPLTGEEHKVVLVQGREHGDVDALEGACDTHTKTTTHQSLAWQPSPTPKSPQNPLQPGLCTPNAPTTMPSVE